MKVRWSQSSLTEIEDLFSYIRERNRAAASSVVARIERLASILADFPFAGHVTEPELRGRGLGTECVRRSVELYFERLKLKQLFCEPNAYNIAPNRALQKAGFRYLKTYKTVPGPMNYHQAVTRWMIER